MEKVMSAEAWGDFFTKTPCVRSSYLFGFATTGVIMAHKLRLYPGNLKKAGSAGLLTFAFTTAFSFFLCASDFNRKQNAIKYVRSLMCGDVSSFLDHNTVFLLTFNL